MDIDVIIGSATDGKTRLTQKYKLNPLLIQAASPLAATDQILAKIRAGDRLERLRIFILASNFPLSQLARLRGLFSANGRLEIIASFPGSGGLNSPNAPSGGFAGGSGGHPSVGGIGGSGGFGGGFSGNTSVSGFQGGGGFQGGFGGAAGNAMSAESQHLSSLLMVPVSFTNL